MGLLLLLLAVLWLLIAAGVAILVTRKVPKGWWRAPLFLLLFVLTLVLPLLDEIVGKTQFERLCAAYSDIEVDKSKASGRTVYLADTADEEVPGTWVRVVRQPWRYIDAQTGAVLVSYSTFVAEGGWLVRAVPVSEGRVPLIFHGYCAPGGSRRTAIELFKSLGVSIIQRPRNVGATK